MICLFAYQCGMAIEKLVSIQIFSVIWLPTFWYDIHVHSVWIQREVMIPTSYMYQMLSMRIKAHTH